MTVRTEQLQILNDVVLMVAIQMMNLEHQFFPIPVPDPANLTMCIPMQYAPNILSLQVHGLDLCTALEYLLMCPVGKLSFVMSSISSFCQAVIKMARI